jgi:hypothetical protein
VTQQVALALLVGVQAALLMPKNPRTHDVLLVSSHGARRRLGWRNLVVHHLGQLCYLANILLR